MAAPKMDQQEEEKKIKFNQDNEKIIIPKPDKASIEKLPQEIQEIYNYKAKYTMNDNGSLTFYPTPNCKPCEKKLETSKISMESVLKKENCKSAACYSNPDTQIVKNRWRKGDLTCSFIISSLTAWSNHYPFRFRAEHLWILILQAVAIHVDKNAEKLRSKYVKHDDKMTLKVDVSMNPSYEEYVSIIKQFAEQIDKNTVKDTCELFDCDFTTSTLTEKLATKVTIMDICKNYFNYMMMTRCGFPQITLDGTKQDWIKLKAKTVKILNEKVDKKFGAEWGKALLPLLDRFIAAFDGDIDCLFWNSMIKRGSRTGSGACTWYSGWINILFPFVNGSETNRYCVPYNTSLDYVSKNGDGSHFYNDVGRGPKEDEFPLGIASAPVIWDRLGEIIDMKFISGFIGYTQDPKSMEICPNVGWCIAYSMSGKDANKKE